MSEPAPLIQVSSVSRRFEPRPGIGERLAGALGLGQLPATVHAVDDVTLTIQRGEAVGLVGESGCGKSTLGRMVAGILPPSDGQIRFDGAPVMREGRRPVKTTTRMQMVFQDPFLSLDPRMRIGDALAEGPIAHGLVSPRDASAYVARWLSEVGLTAEAARRFPHQFSGGQRQRIAIARALAMQPDALVCDEPVASLDVSIQAQIVNLFLKLRHELGLTLLFISHDLGVVRHLCERVAIMYLGRIVETGPSAQVYEAPRHPYTRALLDSVPRLVLDDDELVRFQPIEGELPSPLAPPRGCHFHLRCPYVQERCRSEVPRLAAPTDADAVDARAVACHFPIAASALPPIDPAI